MKRILITGGCGFVGRHLVNKLLSEGSDVWIIDNLFSGKHPDAWLSESYKPKVHFVQENLVEFLNNNSDWPYFDEVYHLAAVVGGRAVLIEQNPMFVAYDQVIDSTFFSWAVKNKEKIGRILYVSSSVAYPNKLQSREAGGQIAMKEEFLDLRNNLGEVGIPESIYGWIKVNGEYLAGVTAKKYGLPVVCVRPFSGYGEDQDLSYPIPSIALRAVKREDPLVVWGSGNQTRDFVYIDDFVDALCLAIRNISDGRGVNIGLGQATSFKEVARLMAEIEGYSPKIQPLAEKVEGSFTVLADPALIKSLGWKPKYSIKEGFVKVLAKIKLDLKNSR
ncbi:MAG: NAD(P)-dependent oxidoreductase [bacterium]|nr:NAD(P)-dependent oxidoreductase [bacterium]